MKYRINPRYRRLTEFVKQLPQNFSEQGELIYKDDDEVRSFQVGDFSLVVKQYKLPQSFWKRLFSYHFRSKAANAFRYARKVTKRGFLTPESIAYVNQSTLLVLLQNCYYVSLMSPITRDMREFGDGIIEGKEHILKAFGRYLAQLHESDVYFPNYSPGNIGFEETALGVQFTLLNINKALFKSVSKRRAFKAFRTLFGSDEMLKIIIEEYAYTRGYNPEEMVKKALINRKKYLKLEEIKERQEAQAFAIWNFFKFKRKTRG